MKTRLDLILDGVDKHGEVNLAIEGEISRERVRQVQDAAAARGMTAAYDGRGFLIRKNPTEQAELK
jgi:hypothetical protein